MQQCNIDGPSVSLSMFNWVRALEEEEWNIDNLTTKSPRLIKSFNEWGQGDSTVVLSLELHVEFLCLSFFHTQAESDSYTHRLLSFLPLFATMLHLSFVKLHRASPVFRKTLPCPHDSKKSSLLVPRAAEIMYGHHI